MLQHNHAQENDEDIMKGIIVEGKYQRLPKKRLGEELTIKPRQFSLFYPYRDQW